MSIILLIKDENQNLILKNIAGVDFNTDINIPFNKQVPIHRYIKYNTCSSGGYLGEMIGRSSSLEFLSHDNIRIP